MAMHVRGTEIPVETIARRNRIYATFRSSSLLSSNGTNCRTVARAGMVIFIVAMVKEVSTLEVKTERAI